jgi:type I restriction enzyme S subunit
MTADTLAFPRAFAVWFRELSRWDASSFHRIKWHWPNRVMVPIGSVLRIRKEKVNKEVLKFSDLQPITIHFDGSIDKRSVDANREYSMDLWFAHSGDIVVAKIDLKNGAVGIVPADWKNVVVTGHFAVYQPDRSKLVPEYLQRIVQARFFKDHLWRNKVGAEGRKEVKLNFFEEEHIPLPPVVEQRAIVTRWRKAQDEIAAARDRVKERRATLEVGFLADLGLKVPAKQQQPRAFAVWWKDIFALSARATYLSVNNGALNLGRYPVVQGHDCFKEVRHGSSASPSPTPTTLEVLKISAVTSGVFDPTKKKYAFDDLRVREEFALRKGDVLLCRTNGTLAYVGMSALIREDMANLIFPDKVIRVRTNHDRILPNYCWQVLQSYPVRAQIEAAARTAVGNYAIGTEDIWNLRIPLPPLSVQKKIMEQVAAGRKEIAREREAAKHIAREINAEVEALILGTKKVSAL